MTAPVDVLVVSFFNVHGFHGGAERYAWGEAEVLGESMSVGFVSAAPSSPAPFAQFRVGAWAHRMYQPPGGRRNAMRLIAFHLLSLFNPIVFVEALLLFRRTRPRVVHTHNLLALSPSVWLAARLAGSRVLHTHQDFWLVCRTGHPLRSERRALQ